MASLGRCLLTTLKHYNDEEKLNSNSSDVRGLAMRTENDNDMTIELRMIQRRHPWNEFLEGRDCCRGSNRKLPPLTASGPGRPRRRSV